MRMDHDLSTGIHDALSMGLRSHVVARSRYAEDRLKAAAGRGVSQFLMLGAGLDTSPYRQPAWARDFRIIVLDPPASQQWKRARLDLAGIMIPDICGTRPPTWKTIGWLMRWVKPDSTWPRQPWCPVWAFWCTCGLKRCSGRFDSREDFRAAANWCSPIRPAIRSRGWPPGPRRWENHGSPRRSLMSGGGGCPTQGSVRWSWCRRTPSGPGTSPAAPMDWPHPGGAASRTRWCNPTKARSEED